ncbi:unnamed protein product [Darwinula stevensoni]|uniref:Uncharacterized protein n=1 Tax=Darwinula stevensoni TaxID=69355 RepID=A0A7R9ADC2_9CRUS|nr:unnamed protein product [Darwinula stevensoni]CAG0901168.1 unnamed protein product [Darwinula stevensoni]
MTNQGRQRCQFRLPSVGYDLFRPPLTCDFCRGIQGIPRVTHLSPQDFQTTYAYTGKPVIVEDGMRDWSAMEVFNFTFFKGIYDEGRRHSVFNCQFFPYQTEFRSLDEVFDMDFSRANMTPGFVPWYVGCYAYTGKPVIVEDGMRDWSAMEVFNFTFFKGIYDEGRRHSVFNCQFFPYQTEFRSLDEVFDMDSSRANMTPGFVPWYVGW